MILVKFRSIFPTNWFVKTQKLITSLGEAVWEASPQLTLQIFIVLTTFDDGISKLQLAVILSSSMSLVIPAIEMYLQRHGEPAKLLDMLALFPLFFIMNIFKILSISILLVFLTLPWVFIQLLLSGTVYFILHLDIYGYSVEAGYQGWLHLTNLDVSPYKREDKDDPNPLHRRVSTIWYFILYSFPLVIILISCNNDPENVYIFDIAHLDYFSWGDVALVQQENGLYLTTTILTTLGLGALGILMDLLYFCCGHGVFIFKNKPDQDQKNPNQTRTKA